MEVGFQILYSKSLLPNLVSKGPEEIEAVLYNWCGGPVDVDAYVSQINEEYFGITYEPAYIINKKQVALAVAANIYVEQHPVIIEYPEGDEHIENWYGTTSVDNSFLVQNGAGIVKVTSPSGYVEEIKLDNTAPTLSATITDMVNNTIKIKVVSTDYKGENEYVFADMKGEYKYYIKGPDDRDYILRDTVASKNYTYTNIQPGVEYSFLVTAEDKAGNIGETIVVKQKWEWVSAIADTVPIPRGFAVSPYSDESKKNKGLVIYELTSEELNAGVTALPSTETQDISMRNRNQYVWVTVNDFSVLRRYDSTFTNDLEHSTTRKGMYSILKDTLNNAGLWEIEIGPGNLPKSMNEYSDYIDNGELNFITEQTILEAQAMYASVKEYGGFYIARYEAGIDNQRYELGLAKDLPKGLDMVHSKMGKIPYIYIPWTMNDVMNEDTNGAVEVARSLYPNNANNKTGVISTLTYGSQWDIALGGDLINYTQAGVYSDVIISVSSLNDDALVCVGNTYIPKEEVQDDTISHVALSTGSYQSFKRANIYDMAGNMSEWTMEGYGSGNNLKRVVRGGNWSIKNIVGGVGNRTVVKPSMSSNTISFRPSLYIKK